MKYVLNIKRFLMFLLSIVFILGIPVNTYAASDTSTPYDARRAIKNGWPYYVKGDADCISESSSAAPSNLTKDQKIAQTLLVGFDSTGNSNLIKAIVEQYKVGGVFTTVGNNRSGIDQIFYQDLKKIGGSNLFIASDDEGGNIAGFTKDKIPSAKEMGQLSAAEAEKKGQEAGQILLANGLNGDLAPVLDILVPGSLWDNDKRNWSSNPDEIISKAGGFAKGLNSKGIKPVYKHFPGIGKVNENTDKQRATPISLTELTDDIKPYRELANQNNAGVMLSNAIVTEWGDEPVSINKQAVDYLRKDVKFTGTITTDALNSLKDSSYGTSSMDIPRAVAAALNAGVDMPEFVVTGAEANAQVSGAIKEASLNVSDARVDEAYLNSLKLRGSPEPNGGSGQQCCSSTSGSSTPLSGSGNVEKVYNFFVGKGLKDFQAAGIIGNIQQESGFEPMIKQGVLDKKTSAEEFMASGSSDGFGLVQWTPGSKYIKNVPAGKDPNDLATQLDFLWEQLNGKTPIPEPDALEPLKASTNIKDATMIFHNKFEKSADNGEALLKRVAYAETFLNDVRKGTAGAGLSSSSSSGTSANLGSCSSGSSSYKNPLRDVKDLKPLRIDGGVDYQGHGPIYALGNGEVVMVNGHNSGWPGKTTSGDGGTYISYKLTDGPAKGKEVFMAENCEIPGSLKKGSTVTSETIICDFQGDDYAYGEMGWADGKGSFIGNECYDQSAHTVYGINFSDLMVTLGAPAGQWQAGYHISCQMPSDWPKWPKKTPPPTVAIEGKIN